MAVQAGCGHQVVGRQAVGRQAVGRLIVPPGGCLHSTRDTGIPGVRSSINTGACSCLQTLSQRTSKSFKPRILITWIIKPRKQSATVFLNTKAKYFLTSYNFLYIHCVASFLSAQIYQTFYMNVAIKKK